MRDHLSYSKLENSGKLTTGKIVEKIIGATQNKNANVEHSIRYVFENTAATKICPLSGPRFTTPKDQACSNTVRIFRLAEKHFVNIRIGDEIDILYLQDDEKTSSVVISFDDIRTELTIKFIFFALLVFLPGVYLYRQFRRFF